MKKLKALSFSILVFGSTSFAQVPEQAAPEVPVQQDAPAPEPPPQMQPQQEVAPAAPTYAQPMPNRPAPREERFVPSEVVAALPDANKNAEVRAVLRTSMGDITIKLDRGRTPNTVNHFVGLARGDMDFIDVKTSKKVRRPFYNGLIFHRATRGFLIQTGCPFGNGRGGPGDIATIKDEIRPPMQFDRPGLVAMAPLRESNGTKLKKDTNGSQFFITLRPMPEWNDKFTVFGEVEEGMDVVKKISEVKVGPTERPIKRVYLSAVDIFEGDMKHQPQAAPEPQVEAQPFQPSTEEPAPPTVNQ
ncbi:MAG TPA: peptidylprolyl isomerase [Bdellovibrionales bacterium]|nr:peptidylprolyl isomerase [Bdellovibrionales bacterium]